MASSLPGPFARDGPIPAVLRVPTEIWLQILEADDSIELEDVINWRSACRALWHTSPKLMALLAARQLPEHAEDPMIEDGFYAEALLAAHRHNMKSAFAVLLPRPKHVVVSAADAPTRGPSTAAVSKGKAKACSSRADPSKLPSRDDWVIGSFRMLHAARVDKERPWLWGRCETCKRGVCLPRRFCPDDTTPAVLRLPAKIWVRIFTDCRIPDIIFFRSVCRSFWHAAPDLFRAYAARMHEQHAQDPYADDGFYGEALVAAHQLNVHDPLAILLPRHPSDYSQDWSVVDSERLPAREDWIIGNPRTLHEAHVARHRSWMFGVCEFCEEGVCARCGEITSPTHIKYGWYPDWLIEPSNEALSGLYSNAIFAADAHVCGICLSATASSVAVDEGHVTREFGISRKDLETSGLRTAELTHEYLKMDKPHSAIADSYYEEIECWSCREYGHRSRRCPQATCSRCNRKGHRSYDCRTTYKSVSYEYEGYCRLQLFRLTREMAIRKQLKEDELAIERWRQEVARQEAAEQASSDTSAGTLQNASKRSADQEEAGTDECASRVKRVKIGEAGRSSQAIAGNEPLDA